MCILALAVDLLPHTPLVLIANREESQHRPTVGPGLRPVEANTGRLNWLGGQDLLAGGTWLGVNAHRVVVAVTNLQKSIRPPNPRSRGWLCRDLLETCRSTNQAMAVATRQFTELPYDGCNLVVWSPAGAEWIGAGDQYQTRTLQRGLHVISNGVLNDADDPRVSRVRHDLSALIDRHATAFAAMVAQPQDSDTRPAPGKAAPGNAAPGTTAQPTNHDERLQEFVAGCAHIVSSHARDDLPAICLHGNDKGTVSSTILTISKWAGLSQYHYAAGPPCTAPFEDYSPLLQELIEPPAAR